MLDPSSDVLLRTEDLGPEGPPCHAVPREKYRAPGQPSGVADHARRDRGPKR